MKNFLLFLVINTMALMTHAQNLISNPSFENSGQLDCQSWYDECNRELTFLCDSIFPDTLCGTSFFQDAPFGGGDWSLQLMALTPPFQSSSQTYITGQSGTNRYELSMWCKSFGTVLIIEMGIVSQKIFTPSQVLIDSSMVWTQISFIDTLTVDSTDTIAIRLSLGGNQIGAAGASCDLIELNKIDSLIISTANNDDLNIEDRIGIYPNPNNGELILELQNLKKENVVIEIFNLHGQLIYDEKLHKYQGDYREEINMKNQTPGIYMMRIKIEQSVISNKVILE